MIDDFFSSLEFQVCFKKYYHYNFYEINEITLRQLADHKRIKLFTKMGMECKICGLTAKYIVVGHHKLHNTKTLTLYSNNFTVMTVDHIIPRSKKGPNSRSNKQCLCEKCNYQKSDKILTGVTT